MIELRPFEKLGKSDHGWLKANFHFSFADYRNNDRVHWGALRVWNNDRIAPQSGFPPHPHRDMEIVTYVIKGAITHQDHLGNKGRTEAGQIQVSRKTVSCGLRPSALMAPARHDQFRISCWPLSSTALSGRSRQVR